MSRAEVISEIPKLSNQEGREMIGVIVELEEDAETLAECDRLALERFQRLDALKSEHVTNAAW